MKRQHTEENIHIGLRCVFRMNKEVLQLNKQGQTTQLKMGKTSEQTPH